MLHISRVRRANQVAHLLQMGIGGKAIPPQIDKVQDLQSDAEFILLVEKDAAFMRLAEDRFYNRFPCVIITAKGQPDVATRCAEVYHAPDACACGAERVCTSSSGSS